MHVDPRVKFQMFASLLFLPAHDEARRLHMVGGDRVATPHDQALYAALREQLEELQRTGAQPERPVIFITEAHRAECAARRHGTPPGPA
jgi:hypothetical protein